MTVSPKLALFGLTVFVTALSSTLAAAELAAWDQDRVTGIAKELAKACDAWQLAIREQPGEQIGSGNAQQEFGMVQKAQLMKEQSQALAGHLEKGKGHDETRNYYRSLKEVMDDTQVQAQQSMLDEPTMDAWAKVADLMRQIAPYYDPKANVAN
jgi:hypothetical protein